MKIPFSTFIKFVTATPGTPRITVVRQAKAQQGEKYDPAKDYWGKLRRAIVEMHSEGHSFDHLSDVVATATEKKVANYSNCVTQYEAWLGKKKVTWIGPKSANWKSGGIIVSIKPELGLRLKDRDYYIKLYFNKEPLSKRSLNAALHLMDQALECKKTGSAVAILDVQRKKLIEQTVVVADIDLALRLEAESLASTWNALDA